MTAGPVRRGAATVGLLALVPTAAMLATGAIDLPDAAVRAAATLVAVMLVARLVSMVLRGIARQAVSVSRPVVRVEREAQRGKVISAASSTIGSNAEPD
jgi:predicted phage tail protein